MYNIGEIIMNYLSVDDRLIEFLQMLKCIEGLPDYITSRETIGIICKNYYTEMINSGYYTFDEISEFNSKLEKLEY